MKTLLIFDKTVNVPTKLSVEYQLPTEHDDEGVVLVQLDNSIDDFDQYLTANSYEEAKGYAEQLADALAVGREEFWYAYQSLVDEQGEDPDFGEDEELDEDEEDDA